ncbi:hypothetical protein BC830DRAFT_799919 [Chytriomyces sp. MP71]|nr:hypothetical protein BC830DRAFT_799919 [Chytriomyces sp. MP71]
MLTVYPFQGYANITDAQLKEMADYLNQIVNAGHSVFFRFASEMNGSWFQYGQDPIGTNKNKVAFIWSPNSGNGYPYPNNVYSINQNATDAATIANLKALDTNGNGKLDEQDNPYLPYYPGDDLVDWVGMSVYHYGLQWPWVDNSVPVSDEFESYLQGSQTNGKLFGYYPFYDYFAGPNGVKDGAGVSVSAGNKPLIISETGASFHFAWDDQTTDKTPRPNSCPVPYCAETTTRVDIKQAWWKSFLNKDFTSKYPQMKAVSFFEFVKSEELTWRDFTTFGAAPNTFTSDASHPNGLTFVPEANAVASAFAADLKAGNMPFLAFAGAAQSSGNAAVTGALATASASSPSGGSTTSKSGASGVMVGAFGTILAVLLTL